MIVEVDIIARKGKEAIKYRKRCELCKFVEIDILSDDLVCTKTMEWVEDDYLCDEFKLDEQVRQDIIEGLMRAV